MTRITLDMLRDWHACYICAPTKDWHRKLIADWPEEGYAPLEVAALEVVPAEDRIWALGRKEVIGARWVGLHTPLLGMPFCAVNWLG